MVAPRVVSSSGDGKVNEWAKPSSYLGSCSTRPCCFPILYRAAHDKMEVSQYGFRSREAGHYEIGHPAAARLRLSAVVLRHLAAGAGLIERIDIQ